MNFNFNFNLKKILSFILLSVSFSAFSLEEPPGTQTQTTEESDAYLKKLKLDREEGNIFMDAGVEKSWNKADVFIPESIFSKSTSNLQLEKKYPVVIYLHGCTGITSFHDLRWGRFISNLGFVVILPDSFARPSRISNCDPVNTVSTFRFPMALTYREQEIAYAINQLRKTSWADMSNIFLMGHSEGANAVAQTNITGFRGMILSSGFCNAGIKFENGVKGLVINYDNDPWHKGSGRCQQPRNDGSISLLFFQGIDHSTFDTPKARDAVKDFLKQNLKK
jgi:dienelactone hydrolase